MYTTCISINAQFLLFIGKLQGGPNSYPLLVHLVYSRVKQYDRINSLPVSCQTVDFDVRLLLIGLAEMTGKYVKEATSKARGFLVADEPPTNDFVCL